MTSPLKVGIVGYGVVGKRRKYYIDQNPNFKVTCVSDITFEKDGLLDSGIRCYNDYRGLLSEQIDVLFVSLPNYLAAKVTISGLERNCHVFCEKPPGHNIKEVREVVKLSEKNPHLKLKYGFNHRYHDSVRKAREIIDSKKLGNVVSFRAVYGKSSIVPSDSGWRAQKEYAGGGILLDQGIHMLDLIKYFSSNYQEFYSFVNNNYWGHNVEDDAFILMKNKDGQIASLHSTATQWQHRFRLEIILKEGLLELAGILSGSKSYGSETLSVIERDRKNFDGAQEQKVYSFLQDNSWRDEINEFSECISKDKPVVNGTCYDALEIMEMIFNIYKSDKKWWESFQNNKDKKGKN